MADEFNRDPQETQAEDFVAEAASHALETDAQAANVAATTMGASKSQGRIIWEQFSRHKSALVGGWFLIFMSLTAVFAASWRLTA